MQMCWEIGFSDVESVCRPLHLVGHRQAGTLSRSFILTEGDHKTLNHEKDSIEEVRLINVIYKVNDELNKQRKIKINKGKHEI